jgi:hypothetical protein
MASRFAFDSDTLEVVALEDPAVLPAEPAVDPAELARKLDLYEAITARDPLVQYNKAALRTKAARAAAQHSFWGKTLFQHPRHANPRCFTKRGYRIMLHAYVDGTWTITIVDSLAPSQGFASGFIPNAQTEWVSVVDACSRTDKRGLPIKMGEEMFFVSGPYDEKTRTFTKVEGSTLLHPLSVGAAVDAARRFELALPVQSIEPEAH